MANVFFSPLTLAVLGLVLMSVLVMNAPKHEEKSAESILQSAFNQVSY